MECTVGVAMNCPQFKSEVGKIEDSSAKERELSLSLTSTVTTQMSR